ncbi:NADP-dependent oxidoreductase [Streptomyces sp. NBC_00328]|uniref:NADP-dependent oxidoreductase n=1 Tax=Streptomyces sp. NBC_00328 TaxID=2903646 RepID=UPI002E2C53A0|nr:NADP-dependent oxidoreductase [Streptomyces sp. NBC_00328]
MYATMHAVRGHRRGGPEELVYEVAPKPVPGRGDVLVEVRAASVTPGELGWDATWTDSFDGGSPRLPVVPSKEVSGVVAELGHGVTDFRPGEAVYGLIPFTRDGAAAEYVTVPAAGLAAKPGSLDHERTAALPLAGLTAWQGLVTHAGVTPGQRVLVHGGAGGVGSFAVQVAAALGAEVTATASAGDADFVRGLGAETVIDYAGQRFETEVKDADVVFDTVGGDTQARSWEVLRPGGVLVSVVEPPAPPEGADARAVFFVVEPDRSGLEELTALVETGRLIPQVDRILSLESAPGAYAALEREHRRGKIVLRVVS